MKKKPERERAVEEPQTRRSSILEEHLGSFMTVEDVAEMLRINKSTVYRMAKAGRLPATRVGRQWRFRLSALEAFLDAGGDAAFEEKSSGSEEKEQEQKVVNRW